MTDVSDKRAKLSRTLLDIAAAVVIVAGMKAASPIVTQLLLIAFIVIVLSPVYYQLVRWRMPSWLALTLLIGALSLGIVFGVGKLAQSITQLAKNMPEYHRIARESITDCNEWFAKYDVEISPGLFDDIVNGQSAKARTGALVSAAQGLFGRGFIVLLIVAFSLCELAVLPKRLDNSKWITPRMRWKLQRVVLDVRHYMGIKTGISLATGILVYIALVVLKVDSPLLLGLTAFLLNYIPGVGSVVAAIPAILFALVKDGGSKALVVAAVYLVVNQILGNVLEPRLMGRGFGVSPVVVLVSMLFWGFVLGPIGMMLSVPLTMGFRVVIGSLREVNESSIQPPEVGA